MASNNRYLLFHSSLDQQSGPTVAGFSLCPGFHMAVVEMSARVVISFEAQDPLLSSHGRCGISSFVAVLIPYYQEDDL